MNSSIRLFGLICIILFFLSIIEEIRGIINYMKINKTFNDYKKANPTSTTENDKNYLDLFEKRKSSINYMYYMFAAITVTGTGAVYVMKNYPF